jgi:Domain of unknown function (DUF4260)
MTATIRTRSKSKRAGYAGLAVVLIAAVVVEVANHSTGYWQIAAFALGPDVPLLFGSGAGLERGQLHPRAVRLYNLVHRFWGPVALVILGAVGVLEIGWLIGGLTWAFHIALDRSLGYGLRTPDGFQRD